VSGHGIKGRDGQRAGQASIDSLPDDPATRIEDLDRLRREAKDARAALRHMERHYARAMQELADVYASRSWRVAQLLRRLFRRGARRRAAVAVPMEPGTLAPPSGIALISALQGVAGCNAQAAAVSADKIAIWDGVSTPLAGWLDALAAALDRFETCGMAGAALLRKDGRIEAAGAAIRPDGSLVPLGAGEPALHPAFASVADVAALPLGAVMLRAEVWRRFGGLDESIATPELALADLASRLRGAGLLVLCQPFARLLAAPGPPADAWAEAFGQWRLRRRAAGGNGLAALGLPPRPPPRVLLVDMLVPTPDRDSGSADIHSLLRIFLAFGYQVTLLPVGDLGRADAYVDELRDRGVRVVANGMFADASDFLANEPDPFDLIMLFRGSVAGGTLIDRVTAHSPHARLILYAGDLHFLRLEREAVLTRSAATLRDALRSEKIELAAITRADCTLLLSTVEQRLIADLLPRARTSLFPIARDIPGRRAPFAPRHGVLFVGGFRHHPNADAMLFFAREIWPLVRARLATTLTIVGTDAPAEVAALANEADGIIVRGHVADLEAALAECRLTVAPLRFGAGIKGKIVSSLAAGVPCVATKIAVEGMGLTDRVHVCVADTPEAFAEAVVQVHETESLWTALSDSGVALARARFSLGAASARLGALLRDLGLPADER